MMRIFTDPVTWEEELRYLVFHDLLLILGIVTLVAGIAAVLIILLKKKRGQTK